MTKQTEKRRIPTLPSLRFPEFRSAGEWENKKLGQLAKSTTGESNREDSIIGGEYAFFDRSDKIRASNRYLFDGEAVIVAGEGQTFIPKYFIGKFDLHQRSYAIIDFQKNIVGKYIFYWMHYRHMYFNKVAVGSTVLSLRLPMFVEFPVNIPSKEEQQKIADCLSSIDELIDAQTQKIAVLKAHKKGLMQQLFPLEGETIPTLRFPEFRDAGEWEEKFLASICGVHNKHRRPISSNNREKGIYPYYGASGIVDYVKDYIFDKRLLLLGEDGAKWGAFEKTAFIVEGKYWVNNHAHVLEATEVNDILLENYLVRLDINPFVTGTAPPKLTLGKLKEISIPIPLYSEEQQKIADCLSSIDELIDAQTQKIAALKAHKKGLMQQLFPMLNENR